MGGMALLLTEVRAVSRAHWSRGTMTTDGDIR